MSTPIVVTVTPQTQFRQTIAIAPTGGLQQTAQPITLKNTIQSDQARRLDALLDIVPDSEATPAGATLVYDPDIDKYVVKLLDLDGGTF